MIDRKEIQVVIRSRGEPANEHLVEWLNEHGLSFRHGSKETHIDQARNQDVRKFLRDEAPKGKKYLWCLNADMVPMASTVSLLIVPGDFVYCHGVGVAGSVGHESACFRVTPEALKKIGDPWFRMTYIGGVKLDCECKFFRRKAEKCGITAVRAGVVGHLQQCVLVPKEGGGYDILWPHELKR